MWKVHAHLRLSTQNSGPPESITWVALCMQVATTVMFIDMLKLCCMRGRPLSIPFISLSLFPSYLLSSIIDCSHCTNFICWLWIMNETRSGGAFSPPLVWYPISRLQCICAIRDQARGSQRVPPSEETLPGRPLCLREKRHDGREKNLNQSRWLALFKTKKQEWFMSKQQACAKATSMLL